VLLWASRTAVLITQTKASGTLAQTAFMSNAFISISAAASRLHATSERIQCPEALNAQCPVSPSHSCERNNQTVSSSSTSKRVQVGVKIFKSPKSRGDSPHETESASSNRRVDTPSCIGTSRPLPLASSSGALGVVEVELCCQGLEKTFQRCDHIQFSQICFALSLVLRSLERLEQDELNIAVLLVMANRQRFKPGLQAATDPQQVSANNWLQIADAILEVDSSGFVCFRTASMGEFLRTFWIRGIDSSPRVIATVCLSQVKIDKASTNDSLIFLDLLMYRNSAFSLYASRHLEAHLREVQNLGLDFEAELCQMVPSS